MITDILSKLPVNECIVSGTPAEYVNLTESLEFNEISFASVKKFSLRMDYWLS